MKCTPASTLYASRHTQELSSTPCNNTVDDNGHPPHTMTKDIAFFMKKEKEKKEEGERRR